MNTFDYIVIGAGSSGCVVASRLSEKSNVNVLLLEAGPEPKDFWISTPAGMAKLFKSEKFNWGYFAEPDESMKNRSLYWPRGKTLGGTSSINGMVYNRGNPLDYDNWEKLGNTGWSWNDVLPFFKKSENNIDISTDIHGRNGELTVSDPLIKHKTSKEFIDSAVNSGMNRLLDINSEDTDGVGFYQHNIKNGKRCSSYEAFIAPIRSRSNLKIKTSSFVKRINFENSVAKSVDFTDKNGLNTVHAAKEVILCAGAINSPQILMLSGIGDETLLKKFNIDKVAHLPGVGKNLQDHLFAYCQVEVVKGVSYNNELNGIRKFVNGFKYVLNKSGYLALGASQVGGTFKSSESIEYPDLQIGFRPMTFKYHENGNFSIDKIPAISASVCHLRPKVRGDISLKSNIHTDSPSINYKYLSEEDDVNAMVFGIRRLRDIFNSKPISNNIVSERLPGNNILSDDQIVEYLRETSGSCYHPVGTCKMGTDEMAVVDDNLRVHQVKGLRVVDASIMPIIISGNTNAPAIMIGEKAADMIIGS